MRHRLSAIYIALLLSVFLLAFSPGGYGTIPEVKYRLFLFICGGYVFLTAFLRIWLALTGAEPIGKLEDLPLAVKCLLGFLFFTIASSLFSEFPGTFLGRFRQEGVLTIGLYVLSCVCLSQYFQPRKWMLFLLGIGAAFTSVLSLIQLTGANPFTLYPEGLNYYGAGTYYSGEFLGTIGNAGLLAGFLVLAAGVLAMAMIKFEFKTRWLLSLPFFLVVLLIFEMGIYAGLVALAVGMVFLLPAAVTSQKTLANTLLILAITLAAFALSRILIFQDGPILFAPIPLPLVAAVGLVALFVVFVLKGPLFVDIPIRRYRIGALFVIFGGICFALLYLLLYSGESAGMLYEASQVLRGNWDDTFGTRRVYIWRHVLAGIRWETLLLGTGPDTLGYWPIPHFSRYIEELGITVTSGIDAAHNEYLHILATGGLLSLLAYLGALVIAAVHWFRNPDNALSAVAGAGVLFYLIQAFFGISQFLAAPFFWACLGVLLYAQSNKNTTGPQFAL